MACQLTITLDVDFHLEALIYPLGTGMQEILDTDRGSLFTSGSFTNVLEAERVTISRDGSRKVRATFLWSAAGARSYVRRCISETMRRPGKRL